MIRFQTACGAAFLLLLLAAPVMAAPYITFTGGEATTDFPNRTFGFEFSTGRAAVEIFSLGFWDSGEDGLAQSHQVGIWSADGSNLLASATVPAGLGGYLDSGFRFVSITPVVLPANETFLAGAFNGTETIIRYTTATTNPAIFLGSTRFAPTPTGDGLFTAPIEAQGETFDDGYFGPNFNGAVPEPSTLMLAGLALACLAGHGWRTRRRRAAW